MNDLIKAIIGLIGAGLFFWAILKLSNKLSKKENKKLEEGIKSADKECCDLSEEKVEIKENEGES